MGSREVRYYMHLMEKYPNIHPKTIAEIKKRKLCVKKVLTLSDKEKEIIEKYGEGANLILNCVIFQEEEGIQNEGDCKFNSHQSR